jgi:branched-subunit amino acid transport protein AzlD
MLVVYCLKDENLLARPYGLPALIAAACTAALQRWKSSSLLSILAGTGAYMLLIRLL